MDQEDNILPKPEVMPSPLTPGVKYSYKVTPWVPTTMPKRRSGKSLAEAMMTARDTQLC